MPRSRRPTSRSGAAGFLLTCAAGFEEAVARALVEDLGERVSILEVSSGVLIVSAPAVPATAGAIAALPYLSGAHQILAELFQSSKSMDQAIRTLRARVEDRALPQLLGNRSPSFRLRVISEGQPIAVARRDRDELERALASWSQMRRDPRGGAAEVWVYARRDDPRVWLTFRLDNPERRRSPAGALKPEIAAALVRLAPIRDQDVFLDAFSGSGAVSVARAHYPHREILAVESDRAKVDRLRERQRRSELGPHSRVIHAKVEDLVPAVIAPSSVDVAVLDPPWGLFEGQRDMDLRSLYRSGLSSIAAALHDGGHCVLLLGSVSLIDGSTEPFEVGSPMPVLVNGKKASALVMRRRG